MFGTSIVSISLLLTVPSKQSFSERPQRLNCHSLKIRFFIKIAFLFIDMFICEKFLEKRTGITLHLIRVT